MPVTNPLPGLYRAHVLDVQDPLGLGRVQVSYDTLPNQLDPLPPENEPRQWAMPCVPFAAPGQGVYLPPQVGAAVWIAFEEGDVERPVFVGSFWEATEDFLTQPGPYILKTSTGSVSLSDEPPATLTLEQGAAKIEFKDGAVTQTGWPMMFSPPAQAIQQRIEALEAAVLLLKAEHGLP